MRVLVRSGEHAAPGPSGAAGESYDAFISYSHAADGRLAPAVQSALQRFAKPWGRRRALRVFRDETGLPVTPGLWAAIRAALDQSRWFVLLASPEAARSAWVNQEIEHWLRTKSADRILPVLTEGEWHWDADQQEFDWDRSTAVPAALKGAFAEEPNYLDLRAIRHADQLDLRHARFRMAIAGLAAPLHGKSKDDLESEDLRHHHRATRIRLSAAAALSMLTVASMVLATLVTVNVRRAERSGAEARRQQEIAAEQRSAARMARQEAERQEARAKVAAAKAGRLEARAAEAAKMAVQLEAVARQAERTARRQRAEAAAARQDAESAQREAAVARDVATAARRAAAAALDDAVRAQARAKEARREAKDQRKRANAENRIAESRRLASEAGSQLDNDPALAMLLSVAAFNTADTREARLALMSVRAHHRGIAGFYPAGEGTSAISDDGSLLALGDSTNDVKVFDTTTGKVRSTLQASKDDTATVAYYSKLIITADERLAVGIVDHTRIGIWDLKSGRLGRTITASTRDWHPRDAVGAGGRLMVTVDGGAARLWNTRTGAHRNLRPSSSPVTQAVFSDDGRRLLTLDNEAAVLWDAAGTRRLGSLPAPPGPLVAFSGNGRVAAFRVPRNDPRAGSGERIQVWDARTRSTRELETSCSSGYHYYTRCQLSDDGRVLMVPSSGDVEVWDVVSGARHVPPEQFYENEAAALSPDGRTLVFVDQDTQLAVWDVKQQARRATVTAHNQGDTGTRPIYFSRDGSRLVTTGGGKTLLWDTSRMGLPGDPRGARGSVGFARDSRTLVAAGSDGSVNVWDAVRGRLTATLPGDLEQPAVAISPDGRTVAAAAPGYGVIVWDVATRRRRVVLHLGSEGGGSRAFSRLAFSPDGRLLAAAEPRGNIHLVRTNGWTSAGTFPSGDAFAFSPDSRSIALGPGQGSGDQLQLRDLATGRLRSTIPVDALVMFGLAFRPDGKAIAFSRSWEEEIPSDASKQVLVWNLVTGRVARTLSGHADEPAFLAYSADSRLLASGGFDNIIRVWDQRGAGSVVLRGHTGAVTGVAFSPDGRTLASSSQDGTVGLWDLGGRWLARQYCTFVRRDLTADERATYLGPSSKVRVCR